MEPLVCSATVQRAYEGDHVIVLQHVLLGVEKLPVGVVDEDDDARPDRATLDEHLFLILEVLCAQLFDHVLKK